ncbi:hypothetical protein NDU88_007082 [Pleurodeles waltl]|uniref:Uncharacterized protein n=1 Tax=Pleurodeles waltl TaxID=8319 RepID=A0AAV7PMR1_PLEWA|nr:hypothetical protein NDU88_007082 [Pleurodeles waltl]
MRVTSDCERRGAQPLDRRQGQLSLHTAVSAGAGDKKYLGEEEKIEEEGDRAKEMKRGKERGENQKREKE